MHHARSLLYALAKAIAKRARICVSASQFAKIVAAFNTVAGCETYTPKNFIWPPKALAKLTCDIVPTPDETVYVLLNAWVFPLIDIIGDDGKKLISIKEENVGGSGFDGHVVKKENIEELIGIFEMFGWGPTVYDDVNRDM